METPIEVEKIPEEDFLKESAGIGHYIIECILNRIQEHFYNIELEQKLPEFASRLMVAQIEQSICSAVLPCPDQRFDDYKGNQTFNNSSKSNLVYEYLQEDEPPLPVIDLYCKERAKVDVIYNYDKGNKI